MKNEIKVSIIVPIFNSELFLAKCLDSIVGQSYRKLELILVNDGSTDSSKEVIEEYALKDNRIVVIHKPNGGIGSAYKSAFEVMTGEYVLFVDSDDWLELNAVESLLQIAIDNDTDMVSLGLRAFNPQGDVVILSSLKNVDLVNTKNEDILKTHFEVLKHPTLVKFYRKRLFDDIILFEQNIGIDEMLTPQLLAKCNKAVYTSKVLYNVLVRQDSVSRAAYNEKKILQTIKVNRFVCEYMDKTIPNYAMFSHFKYLNTLYAIVHQSNIDSNLMSSSVANEVKCDIKTTYNTVKGTVEFNDLPVQFKFFIYLIVNFPIMYKLIVKSVKLLRAKK